MSQAHAQAQAKPGINGIDMEALGQAVAGVTADANQGQLVFRAKTTWQGQLRSRTDVTSYDLAGQQVARRHQIHADEPSELLGENTAPNPQDLLLAALAACMTVGFVVGASNEGIRIDALEIQTECALDLRGMFGLDPEVPPGARKIIYTINVRGSGTREQFEEIHRNVTQRSPNYYHLANPIPFESRLVVG